MGVMVKRGACLSNNRLRYCGHCQQAGGQGRRLNIALIDLFSDLCVCHSPIFPQSLRSNAAAHKCHVKILSGQARKRAHEARRDDVWLPQLVQSGFKCMFIPTRLLRSGMKWYCKLCTNCRGMDDPLTCQ